MTAEERRLKKNADQKVRDDSRRARVLDLVSDGDLRCNCCKSRDNLHVDHIHGGLVTRSGAGHNLEAKILNGSVPLSDFQLLCARCNMSKGDGIYCKIDHS